MFSCLTVLLIFSIELIISQLLPKVKKNPQLFCKSYDRGKKSLYPNLFLYPNVVFMAITYESEMQKS